MKETFVSDASMIFTIPIGSDTEGCGHVMPREFQCVFQDTFKVFANRGFPKPLAAAQCLIGVSVVSLGVMFYLTQSMFHIFPSIVFVLSGMLSYAAGHAPDMRVLHVAVGAMILSLLVAESFTALFLIYWQSKAVCRQHLNTLVGRLHVNAVQVPKLMIGLFYRQPIIQLTHED
ncbi:uncharacterized protein LOC133660008 isoform X3 [Entelurus aequoreus]|uniref:uncharacterized protein LOC133660008 isoform X3 n=1 Tax=Entelurus aequoreus TaxID=161455 RepID=UPI002B1D69A3|nr:uncharacterized protein LOC133660008 isoform X3 [Entelurus aequoreus]